MCKLLCNFYLLSQNAISLIPTHAQVTCMCFASIFSAKTSWLFQPQSGYLGCIQAGETVIMTLTNTAQEAAAQFILQPQYTDNPQNICGGVIAIYPQMFCGFFSMLWL